jgi:RNA polymerase sigma-70 factor (ECF subfamily)
MQSDREQSLNRFLAGAERRALVIAELSTRNREEALDLVQDAMLAFVRRYTHKPQDQWPPLFHRVLQNRIRDWARRTRVRRRWRVCLQPDSGPADTADPIQTLPDPRGVLPEDAADRQAAMQALLRAIGDLPERQRQAVLLRIWEGLDVAATALAMGCSGGSVKTHLSRGLARLRERLEGCR